MYRKSFLTIAVFSENCSEIRIDFNCVKECANWLNKELNHVPVQCTCYSELVPFIHRITTTSIDALIVFESSRHLNLRYIMEKNKTLNIPTFSFVEENQKIFPFPKNSNIIRINFKLVDGLNLQYLAKLLKPLLGKPLNPIINNKIKSWIETGHGCNNIIEWHEKNVNLLLTSLNSGTDTSDTSHVLNNSNDQSVQFVSIDKNCMDRTSMINMFSSFLRQLSHDDKKYLMNSFNEAMKDSDSSSLASGSSSNLENFNGNVVVSEASVPIDFDVSCDLFSYQHVQQIKQEANYTVQIQDNEEKRSDSFDDLVFDIDLFKFMDDLDVLK